MSSPKYFGFVEHGAGRTLGFLTDTYGSVRSATVKRSPEFVDTLLAKSEGFVVPVLTRAQDFSHAALMFADGTVQSSLDVAGSVVISARSAADKVIGAERMKSVDNLAHSAKMTFGDVLIGTKDTMISVREQGFVPSAQKVYSALWDKTSTAFQDTTAKVHERLQAILETKPGKELSSKGNDAANILTRRYQALHDDVVSKQSYAIVHQYSVNTWNWVLSQPFVAKPATLVYNKAYPVVKGYVDPAVEKAQPYLEALESHLCPRVQPDGAPASADLSPVST